MLSIFRLPLTSVAVQKAYNAINSKSGLMIQQLPHHCQQHSNNTTNRFFIPMRINPNHISTVAQVNHTMRPQMVRLRMDRLSEQILASHTSSLSITLSQNNGNNCETKSMISSAKPNINSNIKDNKCSINSNSMVSKSDDRERDSPYGTIKSNSNKSSDNSVVINNNNLSTDWHKVKRRPVVANNEIEQELAIASNNNNKKSVDCEPKMPVLSKTESESNSCQKQSDDLRKVDSNQSLENKVECNLTEQKSDKSVDKDIESDINLIKEQQLNEQTKDEINRQGFDSNLMTENNTEKDSDCLTTTDILLPNYTTSKSIVDAKRAKGNLKSQLINNDKDQTNSSNGTHPLVVSRRVSFDPLALLLDAALEGRARTRQKNCQRSECPLHYYYD